jgi:hypothetical protein
MVWKQTFLQAQMLLAPVASLCSSFIEPVYPGNLVDATRAMRRSEGLNDVSSILTDATEGAGE